MTLPQNPVTFKYTDDKAKFLANIANTGVLVYDAGSALENATVLGQHHGALAVNGTIVGGGLMGIKSIDNVVNFSIFGQDAATSVYNKAAIDAAYKVADFNIAETATEGYLKTYEITMTDGSVKKIDIPKDFLLKDAHVCTFNPVEGQAGKYTHSETGDVVDQAYLTANNIQAGKPTFHFVINVDGDDATEATAKDLFVSLNAILPESYNTGIGLGMKDGNTFYALNTYSFADTSVAMVEEQSIFGTAVTETNNTNGTSKVVGYLCSAATLESMLITRTELLKAIDSIDGLTTEVATVKGDLNTAKTALENADKALDAKIADVSTKAAANATAITAANTKITALEAKDGQLDASIKAIQDSIGADGAVGEHLTNIDASIAKLVAKDTEIDSSVTAIKTRLTTVEGKATDNATAITGVTNRVKALEDLGIDASIGDINGRLDALEADVATAKGDIATIKSDVTTLKSDVATAKTDITNLKSDVTTAKTDITNLKAADKTLQDNIDAVEAKADANTEAIEALDASVTEAFAYFTFTKIV